MADGPNLKITRRNLPHWELAGSVYFVTFRLLRGILSPDERQLVLDHLVRGHGLFYRLFVAVVMPDHVHLLFKPNDDVDLSRVMMGVKGASSRLLNAKTGTTGSRWQEESNDRIMRDEEEFLQKVEYVLDNPVRAGLADEANSYVFSYCDRDACFGEPADSFRLDARTGMSVPRNPDTPQPASAGNVPAATNHRGRVRT